MTWTTRNTGLTGNALNVNYILINPATRRLNNLSHELWIATNDGIYHSINGGRQWNKIVLPDPSNAEFGDSPAATIDELAFHWIAYDPLDKMTLYVLGYKSSTNRVWLYKTEDLSLSWISRGVVTS